MGMVGGLDVMIIGVLFLITILSILGVISLCAILIWLVSRTVTAGMDEKT